MTKMGEKYWDAVANDYDREIFDSLASDRTRVIVDHIDRCSSPKAIAGDFGCGVGKYLTTLGERFKSVYAIDISMKCLEHAKNANRHVTNVVYLKGDLASSFIEIEKVQFALSTNVLIMASVERRRLILTRIFSQLRKGGHLLLVVPSMESALYAHFRMVEWNTRAGVKHPNRAAHRFTSPKASTYSYRTGILNLGGVPTKHFLREELDVVLRSIGFGITSMTKVEYPWASEFVRPPKWMKAPYPWDWLVLCHKS